MHISHVVRREWGFPMQQRGGGREGEAYWRLNSAWVRLRKNVPWKPCGGSMSLGDLAASWLRRAPPGPARTLFAIDGNGRSGRDVGNCGDRVARGRASGETVGEVGGELDGLRGDDTVGVVFKRRGDDARGRDAVKWARLITKKNIGTVTNKTYALLNKRVVSEGRVYDVVIESLRGSPLDQEKCGEVKVHRRG